VAAAAAAVRQSVRDSVSLFEKVVHACSATGSSSSSSSQAGIHTQHLLEEDDLLDDEQEDEGMKETHS
jgi:hypothetical protein